MRGAREWGVYGTGCICVGGFWASPAVGALARVHCLVYCCTDLEDDWYHSQDPVNAGVTFYVKVSNVA